MIKNLKIENLYGEYNWTVSFSGNNHHSFTSNYQMYPNPLLEFEDCEFNISIPNIGKNYMIIKADKIKRTSVYFTQDIPVTQEVHASGINGTDIEDCYVLNDADHIKFFGIGTRYSYKGLPEKIKNCYAAQMGIGDAYGIMTDGELISCYYHDNRDNLMPSDGEHLLEVEMKQQSSFVGWNFNNIWGYKSGVNYDFPILGSSGGLLKRFNGLNWVKVGEGFKAFNPTYETSYIKVYKDSSWKITNK